MHAANIWLLGLSELRLYTAAQCPHTLSKGLHTYTVAHCVHASYVSLNIMADYHHTCMHMHTAVTIQLASYIPIQEIF